MKKHVLTAVCCSLMLLNVTALFAQGKVTGKLVDADTNEALIGAAIVVEGTSIGTITMIDGSYTLDVPAQTNTLQFSYLGYINQTKEIMVGDGQTKDLGVIALAPNTVGINEVLVVSAIARDRETPVALSNIKPQLIEEKMGSQEFPELLKSTPSVYATKGGGGFGDSRITLRGFDSNNIGVLINGVPVNDMESGKVYWSNWAGLNDVLHSVQVQRGLGASRLALSSVGGTKNIITIATEAEKGGSAYVGIGNDGRVKQSFTASTGLLDNNWAVTVSGARTQGDGYIKGTSFDAYSYFLNVSKIINDDHRISFTAFGAPQWHNQRGWKSSIETLRNHRDGKRYNPNVGVRDGKWYGAGYGYNEYHKPQMSLNHYWNINETMMLSTALYASFSQGGGRRMDGDGDVAVGPDGYRDFDTTIADNVASGTSNVVEGLSVNQHNWYGVLSTLTKTVGNMKITGGFDGRYYVGEHYKEITDLLGGQYFLDDNNVNRPDNTPLVEGDRYSYHNDGIVKWAGLFGQVEYTTEQYSAFLTATISHKNYTRIDYFNYTPDNQESESLGFTPWSVKGGFNYNINEKNNVYLNGGYFTRSPFFRTAYLNYTNEVNKDAKYERVLSFDLGYGYTSRRLNVKFGAYYTNWLDKGLVRTFYDPNSGDDFAANIPGLNALHTGVELEVTWKPINKMDVHGMFSLGEWIWQDDVDFTLLDDDQNVIGEYKAYLKDVHVGNAAQLTAAVGVNYEVLPKLKLGFDINHYGKNFADFNPVNRTDANDTSDSWQLPDATILDLNFRYGFKIGSLDASIYGNVNNLLNVDYIIDAEDGADHTAESALVYYGFGTTWATGLKINF
ncbi:TonB-dependent receptor [Carboxylicivirga marina]|uniref:TonB-dependent receptor n=1 Tax=Carboxylicivirga marina TaxID=2800988 RepID=UPI002592D25F|nr:TonB-dependent receptor [uncultured Carboxylicivirga sp.]